MNDPILLSRRRALVAGASLAVLAATNPAAAARLVATPTQSEGPFYPLTLPLDRDNDLVQGAGPARPFRASARR